MDMNFVVGGAIALFVIADVLYLIRQRRRGINSCGCTGCNGKCGCGGCGTVTIDTGDERD